MKLDSLLVVLVLLLAAGGSMLSYQGYTQNLEMSPTVGTYTTTSPYASTSQWIVTSVWSQTTTSISKVTLLDEVARLARWQTSAFIGCGYALHYTRTLRQGLFHISYSVQKQHPPVVHFFLMRESVTYYPDPLQPTYGGCGADLVYAHKKVFTVDTAEFDGEIDLDEAGEYEILLLVQEGSVPGEEIFASIRIEQILTTVSTLSQTATSTGSAVYEIVEILEISSTSFRPAGLGLTYYVGVSVLVIGAVLGLVVLLWKRRMMGPSDQFSQREPVGCVE